MLAFRTCAAVALGVAVLVCGVHPVVGAHRVVFYDTFDACDNGQPSSANWTVVTQQWGCSNCNGGVVADNVACSKASTGESVLAVTAHGDLFTGSGPEGIFRNLSTRGPSDEFTGWAWPQYQPSCAPYCNVRRVGGALHTTAFFGGAGSNLTMEIRLKPCDHTGGATAVWMYNYTEVLCDTHLGANCSEAYRQQCCNGTRCHSWTDVCWGDWIRNQEIDIELPTAAQPSDDPGQINFANARFTSITALPSDKHAKCGSNPPCEEVQARNLGINQADGQFHVYTLNWVPPTASFDGFVSFAVDGVQQVTMSGREVVPDNGQLWVGSWFPNAWAGSPSFDACELTVDYIRISDSGVVA